MLGNYDKFAISSAEKEALTAFKKQYSAQINSLRITDIGFEDYYLIHDLVCYKTGTQNPDQFYAREGMKVAYLYSIFNDGKLNQLYQDYPPAFTEYLMQFDRIFTTNEEKYTFPPLKCSRLTCCFTRRTLFSKSTQSHVRLIPKKRISRSFRGKACSARVFQ